MALTSTTIDVPLLTDSQQRPDTASFVGQLRYAINTQVDKYTKDGEPRVRLVKRYGFNQLPTGNFDPISGLPYSSTDATGFHESLGLFTSLNGQRLVLGAGQPYLLAENAAHWSWFNREVVLTERLSSRNVYVSNQQMGGFDSANVGNIFCYIWRNMATGENYFYIVDKDGTPIRLPVKSDGTANTIPTGAFAKVVSNGVYFFVVFNDSTNIKCIVLTTHGIVQAIGNIALATSGQFDITFQQGKVLVAIAGNSPVGIHTLTVSGNTLVNHNSAVSLAANLAVAWFENPGTLSDNHVYIGTVNTGGPGPVENAYQLDYSTTDPTVGVTWAPMYTTDGNGGHLGQPRSMTGSLTASGLMVFISFLFVTRDSSSTVVVLNDLGGASLEVTKIRQGVAASRTFLVNNRPQGVIYYPSGTATSFIDPVNGAQTAGFSQPTYFLYDLQTQQMTGRWEYANASDEWPLFGATYDGEAPPILGNYSFHVPSSFRDDDGQRHLGMGYIASTVVESSQLRTNAIALANTSDIINVVTMPSAFTAIGSFDVSGTIGLRDYMFDGNGLDVPFQDELFIPGPQASLFTGSTFSEDGLSLAPEIPFSIVTSHDGSVIGLANGKHSYMFVWEWTSPTGERHRSAVSTVIAVNMTGTDNVVTFTLHPLAMTRHPDVTLGVYRTWIENNTPSKQFRKVSNDLSPTLNFPQSTGITFIDNVDETGAQAGEIIYAGTGGHGYLDRDPCPAFRSGCVFQDRVFLIGWDNRIWYSAEKVEGDPLWFNQDIQVISIPTGDEPRRLIAMDGRIIILCDNSVWELDGRGFSDPTGNNVSVTAPQRLPVNNGATQNAVLARDGVVYEASIGGTNGGLFLLGRGLTNVQYSNDIQDELVQQSILGLHVDSDQNVLVTCPGLGEGDKGVTFAYSQLSNTWNTWNLPVIPELANIVQGRLELAESAEVMRLTPGMYVDTFTTPSPVTTAILTDIQTEYWALGGIKNFHRCWAYLLSGTYYGAHQLIITVTADSNGTEQQTQYRFVPTPNIPYQYTLLPSVEEASRVSFRFQDSYEFIETVGNTFGMEMVSLEIAIGKALSRLPMTSQQGGLLTPITVTFTGATLGTGLVLRLNGAQEVTVSPGDTTYTFPVGITPGLPYNVSIKKQPTGQTVSPGTSSGTVGLTSPVITLTVT